MREHHRDLLRELSIHGIKGKLSPTNGNHVRVEWDRGGKTFSIITPNSPSDHRGQINARAHLRRQMKEAGVFEKHEAKKKKEEGVVGLTVEERLTRLELDVVTLLDLLTEKTGGEPWQVMNKIESPPPPKAEESMPAPKVRKPRSNLLFYIPVDKWVKAGEIAKRAGRTANAASVTLVRLKRLKLVDHDENNRVWRKRIDAVL